MPYEHHLTWSAVGPRFDCLQTLRYHATMLASIRTAARGDNCCPSHDPHRLRSPPRGAGQCNPVPCTPAVHKRPAISHSLTNRGLEAGFGTGLRNHPRELANYVRTAGGLKGPMSQVTSSALFWLHTVQPRAASCLLPQAIKCILLLPPTCHATVHAAETMRTTPAGQMAHDGLNKSTPKCLQSSHLSNTEQCSTK
jgi:hypothetical protein